MNSEIPVPPVPEQKYPIVFTATAGEYFRIWIVNLVLTVLTLGIYSAWAKVRSKRYFYNHTKLNNSNFDYHGDPIRILKGRLILLALALLYYVIPLWVPELRFVVLSLLILVPAIIIRGMVFAMTNTSYRGIRFGFERNYKGAYSTYLKGLLITIVTIGLGWLMMPFWHHRFIVENSRVGRTPFEFRGKGGDYSRIVLKGFGLMILLLLVGGGVMYGSFFLAKTFGLQFLTTNKFVIAAAAVFVFYGTVGVVYVYTHAKAANLFWSVTHLQNVRFESRYNTIDLVTLYLGNILAMIFTLGLAYPWARIQLAKYKADNTFVIAQPTAFEQLVQSETLRTGEGAAGDTFLDFWDFDIGF